MTSNNDDEDKSNVMAFTKKNIKLDDTEFIEIEGEQENQPDTQALIEMCLESLKEGLTPDKQMSGLLAISFDKNQRPKFMWAGEVDFTMWTGAIELFKIDFISSLRPSIEEIEFVSQ